jgi:cytochrome c-type biogenesis protein CcmH
MSAGTVVKHAMRLRWRPQRSLLLLLAALAIMVAVWFWLLFIVPKPQTLDEHVYHVAAQLRCPICQGETVADSPTDIAQQMRQVIRTQILQGRSDQEIVQYFVSRYGEQNIIWSPPWQGFTLLIWIVPIVLISGGLILLFFVVRDWQIGTALTAMSETTLQKQEARSGERQEIKSVEAGSLESYREILEEELAADDPLFKRFTTEAK